MIKLTIILLFLSLGVRAQLPTTNISTDDIRAELELTGATTFQAMCTSANVYSEALNPTYCPGVDAAARLANLQSTPYDIGKFRGYNNCSVTVTNGANILLCPGTTSWVTTINIPSGTWYVNLVTGDSNEVGLSRLNGANGDNLTFVRTGTGTGLNTYSVTRTGCFSATIQVEYGSSCI